MAPRLTSTCKKGGATADWWRSYDAYAMGVLSRVDLYRDLLSSRALKRLKDVSFLGAMDSLGSNGTPRRYSPNRFDHTVGVAFLMLKVCRLLEYELRIEQLMVSSALLHDVGHGALSHSTEPFYKKTYGVCHKHFTKRVVAGDLFLGTEIAEMLADHGVMPESVLLVLEGRSPADYVYALDGPINVDTLDGIMRAATFFNPGLVNQSPADFVDVLIRPNKETEAIGDEFWSIKDTVYNNFIYTPQWTVYDSLVTRILSESDSTIAPNDFLMDDNEFFDRFRRQVRSVSDRYRRRRLEVEFDLLSRKELLKEKKVRRFVVRSGVHLNAASDIRARYVEEKGV